MILLLAGLGGNATLGSINLSDGSFCKGLETHGQQHFRVCLCLPWDVFQPAFRLGYIFSESPGTFVAFISFSIVALLFLVTQETKKNLQKVLEFWKGRKLNLEYHYYIMKKVTLNIFNVLFRCTSSYPWVPHVRNAVLGQGAPHRGAVRCQWITRDQCAMVARSFVWGR